ncbi:TRADD-N-associated membrane domain-containing protein [Vibrio cholerae]
MNLIIDIMKELFIAWNRGNKLVKAAIVASCVSVLLSIVALALSKFIWELQPLFEGTAITLAAISAAIVSVIYAFQRSIEIVADDAKVVEAERRVIESPNQPKAAWDLARLKLESYLNRNLNQVRSIFWLTSLVMIVGFLLIGFGVVKAFENPELLTPALLSAVSGLLVNFIGATFLVLYKSTMSQAKEYVAILERINAVGMSVQVLEKIEYSNKTLKDQTISDLSKQLLTMYSEVK